MPFDIKSLIKEKPKTAPELVSKTVNALTNLRTPKRDKMLESTAKYLGYMKFWLFGDEEHEPTKENVIALAVEVVRTELLTLLVVHLVELDFEARKDAAQVFGAVVRIRDEHHSCIGAKYVQDHMEVMDMLFQGYDEPTIALSCGSMFRDCIRDEELSRRVLQGPRFMEFFDKVEVANFEIASDAFSTFKDLLTRHKPTVELYLREHFTEFFDRYSKLLKSANYVTRRQSIKLLGELLMDKHNVKIMMLYVSDVKNLMQMMNLLKDSSRSIQFEAFHVFKVFVANPSKPQAIVDILSNNREKLLKYLEDFHSDKDEDEQFKEEKAITIKEISTMGAQPPPAATSNDPQPQPPLALS